MHKVEAYTALWIEIALSFPSMVRHRVEAYTALWIEIYSFLFISTPPYVEAYTALWIEICGEKHYRHGVGSRLIQPCGLKSPVLPFCVLRNRRGLYSLVD